MTPDFNNGITKKTSHKFVYLHQKLSVANFLLDGFAVLAWLLLILLCHNVLANLMWLIHALTQEST